MIKFTFKDKDDCLHLGMGISEENVKRLKESKPIRVDCKELGLIVDGGIMLFYGETEQALYDSVKGGLGPETEIHIDESSGIKR